MHISFNFSIGFGRGKEVVVIQRLVEAQQALRGARFQRLQEQISTSIDDRVSRNAQTNEERLTAAQEATRSGLKVRITSTHSVQHQLVVTFNAEKTQVRKRRVSSSGRKPGESDEKEERDSQARESGEARTGAAGIQHATGRRRWLETRPGVGRTLRGCPGR
jgi:2,3-bisphosphoglycerate-independent phosphoglycerate mutase